VLLLAASSIAATKPVVFGPYSFIPFNGGMLVLDGAFWMFAFVYVIGDLLARVYGRRYATSVILGSFVALILFTVTFQVVKVLPPLPDYVASGGQASFENVFNFMWRIVIASLSAYLVGSLLNLASLFALKRHGARLWQQFLGSSIVGHTADTTMFGLVAFTGIFTVPEMVNFILLGVAIKMTVETLVTPLSVWCAKRLMKIEGVDAGEPLPDLKPAQV